MSVPIKVISIFCLLVVMTIPVHSNAQSSWEDNLLQSCLAGYQYACVLYQQQMQMPNYGGYGGGYSVPNYGSSSSGSSKRECLYRCSSAYYSCQRICNMAICIDDDCAADSRLCQSQCISNKSSCEAMCY